MDSETLSKAWSILSLSLNLLGNTFVIFATWKFNAIKLDKLSVWIVKLLAAVDIGNGIFILLPVTIVLFHGWVFGDTFCKVSYTYKYVFIVINIFLINFFSMNKMYRCVAPLRNRTVETRTQKRAIIIVTLTGSLLLPIYSFYTTFIGNYRVIEYADAQYMCWSVYTGDDSCVDRVIVYLLGVFLNLIPCFTLVITNTFLTVFALVKAKNKINKMNIVVVILVTVMFLLSVLPYFVYYAMAGDMWSDVGLVRFVTFAVFLSSFSNPIVYLLTNQRFRNFTINFIKLRSKTGVLNSNFNGSFKRHLSVVHTINVKKLSSTDKYSS